jgi:glycosyltransferase involved in cell wall biosynthesis
MNKISAVVIAKNEELMIRECLESLSFCDEVIVVDNGSIDKTKEIAKELRAKIYDIDSSNFSEIRNFGLEKAEGEWVLYLDADERIDSVLRDEIKKAVTDTKYSYYFLKRKNFYLGKNPWPHIEKMQRLFLKKDFKKWYGQLHESPEVNGEGSVLDGFILHFTHRDLESMVNKTINWSSSEAVNRFNQNHPQMSWWRFPRVMLSAFFDSYVRQRGFSLKTPGLIESIYQAFSAFITYAKLWELQQKANPKNK